MLETLALPTDVRPAIQLTSKKEGERENERESERKKAREFKADPFKVHVQSNIFIGLNRV